MLRQISEKTRESENGYIQVNGTQLYYEDTGGSGETVLFSHGLLWNCSMFAGQVKALKSEYRCVSYDHRGQGRSADVAQSEIDMDTLCDDVIALIDKLGIGPVHFCGLSMGGFIGMRLAARHPHLVRSLILCDTSADPEPEENLPRYRTLNFIARWLSPKLVAKAVMPIMHGKTALSDPDRRQEQAQWCGMLGQNRNSIWRACNGVLNRKGVYNELSNIVAPTLVIVGEEDVATTPAKAQRLTNAISGARLQYIPQAGHNSTVDEPAAVTAAMLPFLHNHRPRS